MQDIAEACDVSKMTVSLALRNDPRVKAATREKIHAAAERMGYVTNPYVTTLMARVRSGARYKAKPVIAFLNTHKNPPEFHQSSTFHNYFIGATQRAEDLGFQLEEFALHGNGMSVGRLERIWLTRNIHAVLIPPSDFVHTRLDFHWDRYASAKFGFSVDHPAVNFATTDHFQCMELAVKHLLLLGYKHIALALPQTMDERVNHRWVGGFLSGKWHSGRGAKMSVFVPGKLRQATFITWFNKERPQAIVSHEAKIPLWLDEAGYRIPDDVGFATVDWTRDNAHYSGVNPCSRRIGSHALDLVVSQIHRNEWGIPENPKCVLVPGEWVEGTTLKT